MKTLLTVEHASLCYEGIEAVRDVSFAVYEGEYLCVLGQNGSGKSTLMKGLLRLKSLSNGHICYNHLRQSQIGYVPQQTVVQRDFPSSVEEVVLSGCLAEKGLFPFYNTQDRQRATQIMDKLGIHPLARKSYRELSGGQQQRVLLARALCATRRILVLDEPTAGLDPEATAGFYRLLWQLNQQEGIAIVMVSHDIPGAVQYAGRILHMDKVCRFLGTAEDYKNTVLYRRMTEGGQNVSIA